MTAEMAGWLRATQLEPRSNTAERAMWAAIALADIVMLVVGAMTANPGLGVAQTALAYVGP
jgi:hypothetical protein